MGPLALMATEAGMEVCGSDLHEGAVSEELRKANIEFCIGEQDGKFLQKKNDEKKIDWLVYSSALPKDHKELKLARELGIKATKRDEFIAYLVEKLNLKMIGVAGTHGKTTTTSGIVWICKQIGLPISWLVGTTLGFAGAGQYTKEAKYLVYEADEYDRNFLHYHPWLSVITAVSYDHPDIYPTEESYKEAFAQYIRQSRKVLTETTYEKKLNVAGKVRRFDLGLAIEAVQEMLKNAGREVDETELIRVVDEFPGVGRRMERIDDGVYSDYAHHPEEVQATIEIALEEAKRTGRRGVVAIYEPHQNTRQHEVKSGYERAFAGVEKLYWTPTYLTREKPDLPVITPEEFIAGLDNHGRAEAADFDEALFEKLRKHLEDNQLVLLMTAGPGDTWLRRHFAR